MTKTFLLAPAMIVACLSLAACGGHRAGACDDDHAKSARAAPAAAPATTPPPPAPAAPAAPAEAPPTTTGG